MKRLLAFVALLLLATVALVSTPRAEEPTSNGRVVYIWIPPSTWVSSCEYCLGCNECYAD